MNQAGERENSSVIPSFNRYVGIDFRGAKISSDAGVLMLREIDQRFNITALRSCTVKTLFFSLEGPES